MKLPPPPSDYSQIDQNQTRRALEQEDGRNVKQGVAAKLVIQDSVTGALYKLTVASGVFAIAPA